MRELKTNELDQISGGGFPIVFAVGAIAAGGSTWANDGSAMEIASSALLGGFSGVSGKLAATATGIMKMKWTLQGTGLTVASGTLASGGGGNVQSINTEEIEVEK
jgi:lactobin A/cerein 7B family class IIb bacteriocin